MESTKKELLEEIIHNAPLVLLTLEDEEMIELANHYIPYSTGFEIECTKGDGFNINSFKDIPYIMDVNIDNDEQRFRIPNGIAGILCLYYISEQLKLNSQLNPGSGIHYHVDMSEMINLPDIRFAIDNSEWILEELDSWNYKGNYNARRVELGKGGWLGFRNHSHSNWDKKTAEFRCGEMTFEFKELLKNITHANSIMKRVKDLLGNQYNPIFNNDLDKELILSYSLEETKYKINVSNLQQKLKELSIEATPEVVQDRRLHMMEIIRARTRKNF